MNALDVPGDATTVRTGTRPGSLLVYAALVAVGLMAGLFWAWDVSVMPGLAQLDDRTFVSVVQVLIVAIENPGFYLVLTGALLLPAVVAVVQHRAGDRRAARWSAAAFVLSLLAMIVTGAVHLPLNDALLAAGSDPASARAAFESPWRAANVARTATCVLALLCLGRAMSLVGRGAR